MTAPCVEQSAGRVYLDMRTLDAIDAEQAPLADDESEEVKSMAA